MPELTVLYETNPVLLDAQERYGLFVSLPQAEIIQEGILVETTAALYKGKEYAVRSYVSPDIAHIDFANRLPALVHGLGRQGLEQLVAYSPQDGVLVTRRQPGRPFRTIGLDEAATMTQRQFDELALTIDFATRAKIEVNQTPDSILFDPIEGFSVVDYSLTAKQVSTGRTVKEVGRALLSLGRDLPAFGSKESVQIRKELLHMATQAGISTNSQSDGRALIEADEAGRRQANLGL